MDAFSDTVMQVVSDWLRAVYRKESKEIDRDVDHAVWESFPASDPPSPYYAKAGDERIHELRLVVHCDRLELMRPEKSPTPEAASKTGVTQRLEGTTPEGETVRIEIGVDDQAVKALPLAPGSKLAGIVKASSPRHARGDARGSFVDEMPKTPPEHA